MIAQRAGRTFLQRGVAFQNPEHHQRQQPLSVRRALIDIVTAPGAVDRGDEFRTLQPGGEIGFGVQPALGAQRGHHVGRDRALVESPRAVLGDGAQRLGQLRLGEFIASLRRMSAGQESGRAALAKLVL